MSRKAIIIEWAPILHGYGFTCRQAGTVLDCSAAYYARILRELGVTPKPAKTLRDAWDRLTPDERERLCGTILANQLSVHNVN